MRKATILLSVSLLLVILIAAGGYVYLRYVAYAGKTERVRFAGDAIELAGVLVTPDTPGPHPAVVLLHGAGSGQTHDKLVYKVHTNEFVRRGIAVLAYDKRGNGASGGDYAAATFQDLIDDGVAAVTFLRSRPNILPGRVGLMATSESGWFAPEIALQAGDIAFMVQSVSPPMSWAQTVLFETGREAREAGIAEPDVDAVLELVDRVWQFYIDVDRDPSLAAGPERNAINAVFADLRQRPGLDDFLLEELPPYDAAQYAVTASKASYDPYPFLLKIDVPMIYILAGKDVNVPYEESTALLERLKQEHHKDITIKTYPEAGHYLYRWDWLPGPFVPGYLNLVVTWSADQVAQK